MSATNQPYAIFGDQQARQYGVTHCAFNNLPNERRRR